MKQIDNDNNKENVKKIIIKCILFLLILIGGAVISGLHQGVFKKLDGIKTPNHTSYGTRK